MKTISSLLLAFAFFACNFASSEKEGTTRSNFSASTQKMDSLPLPKGLKYSWLKSGTYKVATALCNQVALPDGYERVATSSGSFAEWLRFVPLLPNGEKVMLFDGREKSYQAGAYRVLDIDVGKSDLQQCADAIMRLKAEYHYSRGEYAKIHFNYTSGHKVSFDDWRRGKKPIISGNKVSFSALGGEPDNSYSNFQKYLRSIFMYAGTASMEKEMKPQQLSELKAGDLFIKGGFPGHAVLIIDVAVHRKTGKKIFLLAQSYMPAQSIHILQNFKHSSNVLSPWYPEGFGATLYTPEWEFAASTLKQFAE